MNIACVLKVQKSKNAIYTTEWVDKLYRGVKRNLDTKFNFYCLTNVETKYDDIPLTSESDGFWNKIELFKKDLFQGPTLYLDLDVVICNNITNLVYNMRRHKFLMTKEPYKQISNSSIMFWIGDYSYLYNNYIADQKNICAEYSRVPRYGDQAYIAENVNHNFVEEIDPTAINWKHHEVKTEINNPKFLIFTSKHQKPSNNKDLKIVRKNWI